MYLNNLTPIHRNKTFDFLKVLTFIAQLFPKTFWFYLTIDEDNAFVHSKIINLTESFYFNWIED